MVLSAAMVVAAGCANERAADPPQTATSSTTMSVVMSATDPASGSSATSVGFEADTLVGAIEFVGVSLDGDSITVRPQPSEDVCPAEQAVEDVQVTELDDVVQVRAVMSRTDRGCMEIAVSFDAVTVQLQELLGGRAVVDALAPDTPLAPTIPAGLIEVSFQLEVLDGAIAGTADPVPSYDFAYAGRVPSIVPVAASEVGSLYQLAKDGIDAFWLVIPPSGESIWLGLGRQTPPPGGPFEPRTRDQLVSAEFLLPAVPGPEVTGQRILIRLEPGAFTPGDQPAIDATKISLTWIEPSIG